MLAAGRAAAAAKSTLNPHAPKCAVHVASILVRRASSVQSWSPRLCGYAGWAAIRRSSALRYPLLQNGGGGRTRRVATTAGSGAVPQPVQGLSLVGRTVLFVPACITLCLGAWQVNRLEWKYGQIELRNQLLASRPSLVASGNEVLERWDELMPQRGGTEFAPMTLRGRFEHDKEVYIGMRGKPGAVEEGLGAGYSVVTPFVVGGANSSAAPVRVLVNRGWVPANAKKQRSEEREQAEQAEQAARRGGTTPPTVEDLQVVIRKGEKGASCTWTDLESIGKLVNASFASTTGSTAEDKKASESADAAVADLPLYFDAVAAPGSDGGGAGAAASDATDGRKLHPMVAASKSAHAVDRYERAIHAPQPRLISSYTDFPVTPWKHKVYAATWFSLSAGITLMWVTSSKLPAAWLDLIILHSDQSPASAL